MAVCSIWNIDVKERTERIIEAENEDPKCSPDAKLAFRTVRKNESYSGEVLSMK